MEKLIPITAAMLMFCLPASAKVSIKAKAENMQQLMQARTQEALSKAAAVDCISTLGLNAEATASLLKATIQPDPIVASAK